MPEGIFIKKRLDLNRLALGDVSPIENTKLKGLYEILEDIGFFKKEVSPGSRGQNKEIFSILREKPDLNNQVDGNKHIRKDCYSEGGATPVHSKIYDFDSNVVATYGERI